MNCRRANNEMGKTTLHEVRTFSKNAQRCQQQEGGLAMRMTLKSIHWVLSIGLILLLSFSVCSAAPESSCKGLSNALLNKEEGSKEWNNLVNRLIEHGCDADKDGLPDVIDACPDDPYHDAVSDPCNHDEDEDGVTDEEDFCQNTPREDTVGAFGCTVSDDPAEIAEQIDDLIEQGLVETFQMSTGGSGETGTGSSGETGGFATDISFKAFSFNIEELGEGCNIHVTGTLMLDTPLGDLPMYNTDVCLKYGDTAFGFEYFYGTADITLPSLGILTDLVPIEGPYSAEVGLESGTAIMEKELVDLDLNPDQYYYYFIAAGGLSAEAGPLSIETPLNSDITFLLDTSDPFFFFQGNLAGLSGFGKFENVGIGFSARGLIPFEPEISGVEENEHVDIESFYGHVLFKGEIPFDQAGIAAMDATMVVNFDPDNDGVTPINDHSGILPDFSLGINGIIGFSIPFIEDWVNFEMTLASGSVSAGVSNDEVKVDFAGILDPDTINLPGSITLFDPLEGARALIYGHIDSADIRNTVFYLKTEAAVDFSSLTKGIGISMDPIQIADTEFKIDKEGLLINGSVDALSGLNFLPGLTIDGRGEIKAYIPWKGTGFSIGITVSGPSQLLGLEFNAGLSIELSDSGAFISGETKFGLITVEMSGSVDASGFSITGMGNIEVELPFDATTPFLYVANGAKCGYKQIQSIALCGFDVGECTVDMIEDVVEVIADGAEDLADDLVDGLEDAADGAGDIVDDIGDGAGGIIDDIGGGVGGIIGGIGGIFSVSDPENPVTAPRNVARKRNRQTRMSTPDSCKVGKWCDDLKNPRDCWGDISDSESSFKGTLTVTLSDSGFIGRAEGKFCVTDDLCASTSASIEASGDGFKICVDVPEVALDDLGIDFTSPGKICVDI